MAESLAKEDPVVSNETCDLNLSDESSSSMQNFSHMISRPDWFRIYQEQTLKNELAKQKKIMDENLRKSAASSQSSMTTKTKSRRKNSKSSGFVSENPSRLTDPSPLDSYDSTIKSSVFVSEDASRLTDSSLLDSYDSTIDSVVAAGAAAKLVADSSTLNCADILSKTVLPTNSTRLEYYDSIIDAVLAAPHNCDDIIRVEELSTKADSNLATNVRQIDPNIIFLDDSFDPPCQLASDSTQSDSAIIPNGVWSTKADSNFSTNVIQINPNIIFLDDTSEETVMTTDVSLKLASLPDTDEIPGGKSKTGKKKGSNTPTKKGRQGRKKKGRRGRKASSVNQELDAACISTEPDVSDISAVPDIACVVPTVVPDIADMPTLSDITSAPPTRGRRRGRQKGPVNSSNSPSKLPVPFIRQSPRNKKGRGRSRSQRGGRNIFGSPNATPTGSPSKQGARGRSRRGRAGRPTRDGPAHTPEFVFRSDEDSFTTGSCTVARTNLFQNITNANQSKIFNDSIVSLDDGEDEDNFVVNIFFCWGNKMQKLPMKRRTPFGEIFSTLCTNWNVPGSNVMLMYNNVIVKADDTPLLHEMLTGAVICCSIVKSKTPVDTKDPNVITVKFQTKNSREKKSMAVHQMAKFQTIIEQFSTEAGVPVENIVFTFDGDKISPTDTPYGLGIEDNFSIDVKY